MVNFNKLHETNSLYQKETVYITQRNERNNLNIDKSI